MIRDKQYAWAGAMLLVDLASGTFERLRTGDYAAAYIGGRGIAGRLYWDMAPAHAAALAHDNPVILMAGPLAGTPALACSRMVMFGRSSLLFPDQCGIASMGGQAAGTMKAAGLDGIIIRGKASHPVLLHVSNAGARLCDARGLWGLDIPETLGAIARDYGRAASGLCIGPAGEQRLRLALVATGNGSFAGHGFGAVWGSKMLKAIVLEGAGRVDVARPDALAAVNRRIRAMIKGRMLMGPMIAGIELVRRSPCRGCPAGCSRGEYRHVSGRQEHRKNCAASYFYSDWDKRYHGGEPSGDSFLATSLCNRYGVCTQELTKMLTWLHRCLERGVLSEQASGLELRAFGSSGFFEDFMARLIRRQGFCELLGEGTMRAARALGPPAEQQLEGIVEGAGFAADLYNPRYFITNAIFHATDSNPMPQLHEVCYPAFKWVLWYATDGGMSAVSTEAYRAIAKRFWLSEDAVDFSKYEGKGAVAALIQNRQYAKETLVGCDFFYPLVSAEGTADHVGDPSLESQLLSAATGLDMDEQQYYAMGERIFNLQRAIRAREGSPGRAGDTLPAFNFHEPLEIDKIYFGMFNPEFMLPGPQGELITRKGAVLDRDKFEAMLDEYYQVRGWDVATGLQKKSTLRRLGLDDISAALENHNLIHP